MSDVALVIGHHPEAPGAALRLGAHAMQEYELWSMVARELARTLEAEGVDTAVVERPNPQPDQALAERVNATGAEVAVELHFNAAATPEASGTEMLHWPGSHEGEKLAARLQRHTLEALKLNGRGLKARGDLPFLELTEMQAVIAEPAFGSNSGDAWTLLSRLPDLMRAYRSALIKHLSAR